MPGRLDPATRLQQLLLSWDYWAVDDAVGKGGGFMPGLKAIPQTFSSYQVKHCVYLDCHVACLE